MRRPLLVLVAAASVVLAACSPAAQPAAPAAVGPTVGPAKKVAIAYSNLIADSLSLWVARESGIFTRNGLDVDLQYIASSNAFAALLAGQVQASAGGGSEVISGTANGADVLVVANLMPIYPYFMEATADIKTAADFKGKSIAITNPGATFDIASRVALRCRPENRRLAAPGVCAGAQDRATTIKVLKQYLKSDDDAAMGATYEYFVAKAPPTLPRPEQFMDSQGVLTEQNARIRDIDLNKLLDAGYFQSAIDRKVGG